MRAWWEEGGAAWAWCIHLWTWEEELLVECRGLLPDFVYQPVVEDRWVWRTDPDGGYTVRGAYSLTFTDVLAVEASSALIWHTQVPIKVFVLAWWLFVTGY
jgi:hypothetical protein